MKAITVLLVMIFGVCLAILYYAREQRPGEIVLAPMSIDFGEGVSTTTPQMLDYFQSNISARDIE